MWWVIGAVYVLGFLSFLAYIGYREGMAGNETPKHDDANAILIFCALWPAILPISLIVDLFMYCHAKGAAKRTDSAD